MAAATLSGATKYTSYGARDDVITIYGNGTVNTHQGNDVIDISGVGKVSVGSGNDFIRIGGAGSVTAADGNDSIWIGGNASINAGSGNDTMHVVGDAKVKVGNGDNQMTVGGSATIAAGDGNNTISVSGAGNIETGSGNDSVQVGSGRVTVGNGDDTVAAIGLATVTGNFGTARLDGGSIESYMTTVGSKEVSTAVVLSGDVTMLGGCNDALFVGGGLGTNASMRGGSGNDTFWGGQGNTTMSGGTRANYFEFFASAAGGQHVITNFVSGKNFLYLEGESLDQLQNDEQITVTGGNTIISLDSGQTTITLQGFTSPLKATDIKTTS